MNPHRGQVSFGDYTLSMSINAICELEAELNCSVQAIAKEMDGDVRMTTVRAVLWAALRDHHPDISKVEAGQIAQEAGIPETVAKIGEAFAAAFPAREKGSGKPRPPKARALSRSTS